MLYCFQRGVKMGKKKYDPAAVLRFIEEYMTENGYAPTIRDVCKGCNITSTATCFQIIKSLADKGLIEKSAVGENKRRALSIKLNAVKIPLLGEVAAGEPIFAQENYEDFFSVPANMFGDEDMFMLTVKGNSMIKIGMFNGDKIIVKKQETAENGEIVVALVDDSATVNLSCTPKTTIWKISFSTTFRFWVRSSGLSEIFKKNAL